MNLCILEAATFARMCSRPLHDCDTNQRSRIEAEWMLSSANHGWYSRFKSKTGHLESTISYEHRSAI